MKIILQEDGEALKTLQDDKSKYYPFSYAFLPSVQTFAYGSSKFLDSFAIIKSFQ